MITLLIIIFIVFVIYQAIKNPSDKIHSLFYEVVFEKGEQQV